MQKTNGGSPQRTQPKAPRRRSLAALATVLLLGACGDSGSGGTDEKSPTGGSANPEGNSPEGNGPEGNSPEEELSAGELCFTSHPEPIPTGIYGILGPETMTIANGSLYVASADLFQRVGLNGDGLETLLTLNAADSESLLKEFNTPVLTQKYFLIDRLDREEFTHQLQVYDYQGTLIHEWPLEDESRFTRPDNKTGLVIHLRDAGYSTVDPETGDVAHYEFDTPIEDFFSHYRFVHDGSIWVRDGNQLKRTAIGSTAVEVAGFDVHQLKGVSNGFAYFVPSSDTLAIMRVPSDADPPEALDGLDGFSVPTPEPLGEGLEETTLLAWDDFFMGHSGELIGLNWQEGTVAHFGSSANTPQELGSISKECVPVASFAGLHEGGASVVVNLGLVDEFYLLPLGN